MPSIQDATDGTNGQIAQIFHDMGGNCEIKRVDKNKKVLGTAKPEDFELEVNRAQRMGTVAEGLKGLSRAEKMQWALALKDEANDYYRQRNFKAAATAYNFLNVLAISDGACETNVSTLSICNSVRRSQNDGCLHIFRFERTKL